MQQVDSIFTALNTFGPTAVVLVILLAAEGANIWRSWRREDKLQTRVEALETEVREKLYPIVEDCKTCIQQNTQAFLQLLRK